MPACRASPLRPSLIASAQLHDNGCVRSTARILSGSAQRRSTKNASTAAALAVKPVRGDLESTFHSPVRTVLHKTTSLLPRVLPQHVDIPGPTTSAFWQEVLDGAYHRLNHASADSPARIVVYGCDQHSGARELVTALLEEPFAADTRKAAIRGRWKEGPTDVERVITYGYAQADSPASLRTPSPWLQQFPAPLELHELPNVTADRTKAAVVHKALLSSDVPVIVCNPVTTPLAKLRSELPLVLHHGSAILVLVCSPDSANTFEDAVMKSLPKTLSVVFVDPPRALNAIQTLSAEPSSSVAVQRYQDNYAASGVSQFTAALARKLSVVSSGGICALYALSAKEQIKASLSACHETLKAAEREADAAVVSTMDLRDYVAELEAIIEAEVLGVSSVNEVQRALAYAKTEVQAVMERLTWWRCVWRVDDIGDTVRAAVDKAWCRDLEDRLIFHTGRLAVSQDTLASGSRMLLASYMPPSPFHSPVLQNAVAQIQASPTFRVTTQSLTGPLYARKMQLAYPTNMLHSTAQRVTLGMGTSVLAGFGTAWAGWAEKLGVLGGALGPGMELETAVGTGMMISAFGVWWMVGRWEKAKKKWWRDWERIGQGLERDVKAQLHKVVRENVVAVPVKTFEGLDRLVEERREEIGQLRDEVSILEDEVRDIDAKSTP